MTLRAEHHWYCDRLAGEIRGFNDTAAGLDPAAPVPTCPEWTVKDLLEHIGTIHRWVTHMIETDARTRVDPSAVGIAPPADPSALPQWFADGGHVLVTTLRSADPAGAVWTWGAEQGAAFWARRMLHETGVHHVDARAAAALSLTVDQDIAADGIDELFINLPYAGYFSPNVCRLRGHGERLRFTAADSGDTWSIYLHADGFDVDHSSEGVSAVEPPPTAHVHGKASDVLLVAYGRRRVDDGLVAVEGDHALVQCWLANAVI